MSFINKEFSRRNFEELRIKDASKSNGVKYAVEAEQNFNKYLKSIDGTKNFNKNLFDRGVDYFNVGGNLDKIPNELLNNDSFMRGYRYAERLSKIDNINNARSK